MCDIPLFLAKMAWPCIICDVIAPWPDKTRSIFFYQKLRKRCLIRYKKFQNDLPHSSGCIAKNLRGVASTYSARARVKNNAFPCRIRNKFKARTVLWRAAVSKFEPLSDFEPLAHCYGPDVCFLSPRDDRQFIQRHYIHRNLLHSTNVAAILRRL